MNIRLLILLTTLFAAMGCRREDSRVVSLEGDGVVRVETCHVKTLAHTVIREDKRFFAMKYACGVPETALKEKDWWGSQTEPLAFTMELGDCLPLDETFYCVTAIEIGKASLKPTYKWANKHHDHLELIR